jgi:hypothetical protein
VGALTGPVESAPDTGLLPDQPSAAEHSVAFVEDHVRVVEKLTVSAVCNAVKVSVGGGTTVADALADAEPPSPEQFREKLVVELIAALTSVPEVGLAPDHPPEAVQDVALVLLHVNVTVWPAAIELGSTLSETVGTGKGLSMPPPPLPPPPPHAASTASPVMAATRRTRRETT